jgi:diacylglycerol kinase
VRKQIKQAIKSFSWAMSGISVAFRTQFNFRFHVIMTVLVIMLGILLKVTVVEWCILLLCIGSVLTAELLNTSLEFKTDLLSPGYHETAKHVKDLAAAAVLVAAIVSALIGLIIFIPKLIAIL